MGSIVYIYYSLNVGLQLDALLYHTTIYISVFKQGLCQISSSCIVYKTIYSETCSHCDIDLQCKRRPLQLAYAKFDANGTRPTEGASVQTDEILFIYLFTYTITTMSTQYILYVLDMSLFYTAVLIRCIKHCTHVYIG